MGRREETTEYLKECMADAFLDKLATTPPDKIRLTDIAEQAGVGRVTFYRHFETKNDLLAFKLSMLWSRWLDRKQSMPALTEEDQSVWFFSFFYEIRDFVLILSRYNLMGILLSFLQEVMAPLSRDDKESRYFMSFFTYGLLGIVAQWASEDFAQSTGEVVRLFRKFCSADQQETEGTFSW